MRHHDGVVDADGQDSGIDPEVLISAAEQAPVILMVCEGPDLTVVGFNAATGALMSGRAALGRPLRDVFHELNGQQFIAEYNDVYRTGVPATGQEWRAHIDRPDGSVHEMYANFTITPWRHPDGGIRGVIGVGFDVTDMVRARITAEQRTATLQERYERSLDVVTALQRELLPAGLPVLPGVQLAASYLVADADTAAGGDWFDVVAQPDGAVALMAGDVVGHGVPASGVMGQLRAVLQDRLATGTGIADALSAADRFARRLPAAHATTVCLAVLDPADGTLAYCTAGHPVPLVISADGDTRYLAGTGGTPLCTGGSFPVRTDRLDIGDLLLLYTDGILERPGLTIPAGPIELARVAADSAAGRALHDPKATPTERVCTQTVELLVRATGHTDDITLLAAQRVAPPPALELRLPGELSSLRVSRAELTAWMDRIGVTEQEALLLQHALGELVTNAIEHAFGGEFGRDVITLRAALSPDGTVEATVTDHGRWREPSRQPTRGRGLALAAQLMDNLRVEPSETGTIATVRHALHRPARMLSGELHGYERAVRHDEPAAPALTITETGDPDDETHVRADGPLDAATADHLRRDLLRRSRGGTVPLTVDLTGVTHLASAGVSALHHVADRHAEQQAALTLFAAPGSAAQHVLALVALPYATAPMISDGLPEPS
jgi:serine phosphatase RsbU (regulator of sigma subunit)/anti-sigma regulatory factor (Ser/Thr protein kinase)/anti-anti-sigma regulatory factor